MPAKPPTPPPAAALECAREVLGTMPVMMASLRCEMRRDEEVPLTMMQFHTLTFLERHGRASLSQLAGHLGLGLPAASKIVDGLVHLGRVERQADPQDRRRLSLGLSAPGQHALEETRRRAEGHLARFLTPLAPADRQRLVAAMRSLRDLFPTEPPPRPTP